METSLTYVNPTTSLNEPTLTRTPHTTQPSIIRLGVLLLLFDVYLTWARIEKQSVPEDSVLLPDSNFGRLAQQPIVFQYMFFCTFRKYFQHC